MEICGDGEGPGIKGIRRMSKDGLTGVVPCGTYSRLTGSLGCTFAIGWVHRRGTAGNRGKRVGGSRVGDDWSYHWKHK